MSKFEMNRGQNTAVIDASRIFAALSAAVFAVIAAVACVSAQGAVGNSAVAGQASTHFRIGEKLTYNVSFGKFINAAYMETTVVSRGKLSGQEAVELRSRVKTLGLVSAAFIEFDEDRTVFASPYTGLPLYVSRMLNNGLVPQETIGNYLTAPTTYYDPLTLVFKAREMGGSGSYSLFEKDSVYTVVFQPTVAETVKTEAGDFETMVSTVQSDFLTANGIRDLKINFSTDENHLPVLIRFRTVKGDFTASLMAVQLPPTIVVPPAATPTPGPPPAVKPKPTATPYIDNQPLSPDLGFELGETLNYRLSAQGSPAAVLTLQAVERKQFQKLDSLLLTATVTSVEPTNQEFRLGDYVHAQVDPETLAPRWVEIRFAGSWKELNQTITFDRKTGAISLGTDKSFDAPIGTHTLLSLLYAIRSFNLKPSKDPNNPVNDTRVAVFLNSQPSVFTLRPSNPEDIVVNGETISAQLVTIKTGNEMIDKLGFKIWLAVNGRRYPVRITLGAYQADLLPVAKQLP